MLKNLSFRLNLVLIVLAVIILNIFAINVTPGLGTGMFQASLIFLIFLGLKPSRRNFKSFALLLFALIMALAPVITDNQFVRNLNFAAYSLTILTLIAYNSFVFLEDNFFWLISNLINSVGALFHHTLSLLSRNSKRKSTAEVGKFVKVLSLTIVVLIVFGAILSSADPVFARIIQDLTATLQERLILSLLLMLFLSGVLTFTFNPNQKQYRLSWLDFIEAFVPSAALAAMFGLFIFIQIKYLFGGHELLQNLDMTYSDYVRQGFNEMLLASALGGILVYILNLRQRYLSKASHKTGIKMINSVLIVELLAVLGSAAKRDWMYIETYGLSRIRFVGGVFLIWLAGVLLFSLAVTLFKWIRETKFIIFSVLSAMLAVSVLTLVNMDQLVYQFRPQDDFESPDFYYLSNLSADIVFAWRDLVLEMDQKLDPILNKTNLSQDELRYLASIKMAVHTLQEKRDQLYHKYESDLEAVKQDWCEQKCEGDSISVFNDCLEDELPQDIQKQRRWQSFNLSEWRAYQLMQANQDVFYIQLNRLMTEIETYQRRYELILINEVNWRENEFEMPLVPEQVEYDRSREYRLERRIEVK